MNERKANPAVTESIGIFLKKARESRRMSLAEVSRVTRIPVATLESLESDHFDDLPGEVFVRGFLKSYAQAVRLVPEDVLARYTSCRRIPYVTPLPVATPIQAGSGQDGRGKRFGVAIAFVVLLILFTLAISIVLKPRGHDMPAELSQGANVAAQLPHV
jgi:cytoskeletal protein RodZ